MAFSQRFGAQKEAADQVTQQAAVDEDEPARLEQRRREKEEADRLRNQEQEAAARRRQQAFEMRRKAEAEEQRRREYEAEKARQATIARSKKEAAKRAMGPGDNSGELAGFGSRPEGGISFPWKRGPQAANSRPGESNRIGLPSQDECEMGISAMISRTVNGMKEGLAHLGLPNFPLNFVPGQELKLCGHNLREEVNEMIHAWMTDEKNDFYECLTAIKKIVSSPLLSEEEISMMDQTDNWVKVTTPDGQQMYSQKGSEYAKAQQEEDAKKRVQDDDADDDEVIDVAPSGARVMQGLKSPSPSSESPSGCNPDEDYYALLGVDPSATLHDIRVKFRQMVLTEHPEKGGDIMKFQRLNKAYSVLSDMKKRQEFDKSRSTSIQSTFGGHPSRPPPMD